MGEYSNTLCIVHVLGTNRCCACLCRLPVPAGCESRSCCACCIKCCAPVDAADIEGKPDQLRQAPAVGDQKKMDPNNRPVVSAAWQGAMQPVEVVVAGEKQTEGLGPQQLALIAERNAELSSLLLQVSRIEGILVEDRRVRAETEKKTQSEPKLPVEPATAQPQPTTTASPIGTADRDAILQEMKSNSSMLHEMQANSAQLESVVATEGSRAAGEAGAAAAGRTGPNRRATVGTEGPVDPQRRDC